MDLAALDRAVAPTPAHPLSPERAQALSGLGSDCRSTWRYDESLPVCEEALALARAVGAEPRAEVHALDVLGIDLAYLGRAGEAVAQLGVLRACGANAPTRRARRTYIALTDVLTMLGRPRESARVAESGA